MSVRVRASAGPSNLVSAMDRARVVEVKSARGGRGGGTGKLGWRNARRITAMPSHATTQRRHELGKDFAIKVG